MDFKSRLEALQTEFQFVSATLSEKGARHFGRAWALGGALVFASYWFVYTPPGKKLARLASELARAQTAARYADNYKSLKERLDAGYARLPGLSERSQWLTNTVVEALKAEGLNADSLLPVSEEELGGLIFQHVGLSASVKFSSLASWVLRLEAVKPAVHVSSIQLNKKLSAGAASNELQCTVSTVIPKERY